jgi:hypothetical protein
MRKVSLEKLSADLNVYLNELADFNVNPTLKIYLKYCLMN